jgi:universal stress protein A
MPAIQRILVPVDCSACSRAALNHAALFHEKYGAQIDLLYVYYAPHGTAGQRIRVEVPGEGAVTLEAMSHREAERELTEFLAHPDTPRIEGLHVELVAGGNPYRKILERAEWAEYDLLVIGTHGRTGFTHLLMGSVAEKVVRHAPCPVLSVRGPVEETEAAA